MTDKLTWIVDVDQQAIKYFDDDTGVTLRVEVYDAGAHTWIWGAIDPDGDEFPRSQETSYGPREHQTLWGTLEAAAEWYAGWLASDDGEEE